MKRLVYGILRAPHAAKSPDDDVGQAFQPDRQKRARLESLTYERLPSGPEGSPVDLLSQGGLAAAFSLVSDAGAAPSLASVQAYAQVVEALHQVDTILPMRFGCLLETEAQIRKLLQVRRAGSLAALDELEGCVEMGLRVLPSEADLLASSCRSVAATDAFALSPCHPGTGYLAQRRTGYVARDSRRQHAAGAGARYRSIFAGLFVKCETEPLFTAAGMLLSLQFLVRRENGEGFRAAFHSLQKDDPQKVLLSGPWPPYHFASSSKANGLPEHGPKWESFPEVGIHSQETRDNTLCADMLAHHSCQPKVPTS